MPMLTVEIPQDALSAEAEAALLGELTDLLIRWEGADPSSAAVRSLAWLFLYRPAGVYVGGDPAPSPHYRITAAVPQGQYDDERRAGMVAAVTAAVLSAEQGRYDDDPTRIWVFPTEVAEGTWGNAGHIWGLADIAGFALGDLAAGRQYAHHRLAALTNAGAPTP